MEKIYASPLSEPSRTVAWLCQLNNRPIEYNLVDVMKGETRTDEFLKTNPMGKIPVLVDGDFVLTESHAIMVYLVEKHGWLDWYPQEVQVRARIHEYLNWHHQNTRLLSEVLMNELKVKSGRSTPEIEAALQEKDKVIYGIVRQLEYWLRHGNAYIATQSHPSIADLSCYNELVQLEVAGHLNHVSTEFPKVSQWLKRMKSLPHHDQQLAAMIELSNKYGMNAAKM